MTEFIREALGEASDALTRLMNDKHAHQQIENAAGRMAAVFNASGRVFSCGNGGSMCDAMHFAEELSGRFRKNRKPLAAAAISDPGYLSCVANDFGYDRVFSRYIEAHGRTGDLLFGISTSGASANVIKAAETAKARQLNVIALTGKPSTRLGEIADVEICAPAGAFADRSQELHIKIIHILIELVERRLFPENYEG
ncbi:MAG: SIS domain-containing protein [Desulfobacteraceae bacterium]|nr:SIS domain-containing protein [Desulfobacteraceae bacterium]